MAKDAVLRRIDESWAALGSALDGIPADRTVEPGVCGGWSIKDLLGHIAFWDRQAIAEASRRAAGEPSRQIDWQVLNEREAAANAGRSHDELKAAFEAAHRDLLATLHALPDLNPDWVRFDTWEHYDEHAAEIRAWRQKVGI